MYVNNSIRCVLSYLESQRGHDLVCRDATVMCLIIAQQSSCIVWITNVNCV